MLSNFNAPRDAKKSKTPLFGPFLPTLVELDIMGEILDNFSRYDEVIPVENPNIKSDNHTGVIYIDLDETLTHTHKFVGKIDREKNSDDVKEFIFLTTKYRVFVRPHVDFFLNFVRKKLNLKCVLFTVGEEKYARKILNFIDFTFDEYLFRPNVNKLIRVINTNSRGKQSVMYSKDISLFSSGEDLKRSLLLDNHYLNCIYNWRNSLTIKDFKGIPDDELRNVTEVIKHMFSEMERTGDIRSALQKEYVKLIDSADEFEAMVLKLETMKKYFTVDVEKS